MTPSDLVVNLLMVGLCHFYNEDEDEEAYRTITVNDRIMRSHPAYRSMWRYPHIHSFDIGVIILEDERVLIVYELDPPNQATWEHSNIFNDPEEAWGFVRDFIQEHP